MKGTLIVSSPHSEQYPTLAVPQNRNWGEDNTFGQEDTLDVVLRLVYSKSGVWVPKEDVAACHPIGNQWNYSFVLKIWNRKPHSAWDVLTSGMMTGYNYRDNVNFSNSNVFINFMITKRRIQISKQVRSAKKNKLIDRYAIDQNGRIFVRKIGADKRYYEVFSVNDINNHKISKNEQER